MHMSRRTALSTITSALCVGADVEHSSASAIPPSAGGSDQKETIAMNMIPNHAQFCQADAELLRLGEELDRLLEEGQPITEEAFRLDDERHEIAIAERVAPGESWYFGKEECRRYCEIGHENGAEVAIAAQHRILEQIDCVCRQIRSLHPASLAGLAVWARATRYDCACSLYEDTPLTELDWDKECLVRLLDLIEDMGSQSLAA